LLNYVKVTVRPKVTDHSAIQMKVGVIGLVVNVVALLVTLITWFIDRQPQP